MIYFKSKRQAKGVWRIHFYDRTVKVVNGIAAFEKMPPEQVRHGMRLRGFEEVDSPEAKEFPPGPPVVSAKTDLRSEEEQVKDGKPEGGESEAPKTGRLARMFRRKSKEK